MKYRLYIFFLLLISGRVHAQESGFYANGYLLYGKDTSWCKVWINPASLKFTDTLITWQYDQQIPVVFPAQTRLTGFGITEPGYISHYGRVKFKTHNGEKVSPCRKIVTGTAELYEHPYMEMRKAPNSFQLEYRQFFLYFIGRTDEDPASFPVLLNPPKKKKVAAVLKNFPGLKDPEANVYTGTELAGLVMQFNEWFHQTKSSNQ